MLLDVIAVSAHLKNTAINSKSDFFKGIYLYWLISFIAALKIVGTLYHFLDSELKDLLTKT